MAEMAGVAGVAEVALGHTLAGRASVSGWSGAVLIERCWVNLLSNT